MVALSYQSALYHCRYELCRRPMSDGHLIQHHWILNTCDPVMSTTAKPDLCRNIFIKDMLKFSAQKIPGNALLTHTKMKKYKVFN